MAAPTPETPHLLVAEADSALRSLSQHALVEMGYTCTLASSLEQAQRLLQQQPFALVVTGTFSRTQEKPRSYTSGPRRRFIPVPRPARVSARATAFA